MLNPPSDGLDAASPLVSVIVPTMAAAQRGELLKRAVASIRASSALPLQIIVVVNGNRRDAAVCAWLEQQPDVRTEYVDSPSAPGAILRGRELVQTPYFSMLDDDDEYLPGATDKKLAALQADAQADFLVANAYICLNGVDRMLYKRLEEVSADPLASLMLFNWLHNGNALYRSASVGADFFRDYHPYAEWTWLAFKLVTGAKRVATLDMPVFRYHDTVGSLSKSGLYMQALLPLLQRMLDSTPPPHIARMIQRKRSAAYHDASVQAVRDGRRSEAWKHHLHSLVLNGGLRYISYTRHLLRA
jgi:glycosyltransferase involved in cell wall biosynthesis